MKESFEQAFSIRVARFFLKRGLTIQQFKEQFKADYQVYCHVLFEKHQEQHRVSPEKRRFVLTQSFMLNETAAYLNIDSKSILSFFKTRNTGRHSARFFEKLDQADASVKDGRKKSNLINLVGRHHQPRLKITKPNGEVLSPRTQVVAQHLMGDLPIYFSPLKKFPPPRLSLSDNTRLPDVPMIAAPDLLLSREMSPKKILQPLVAQDLQCILPAFENQVPRIRSRGLFAAQALLPIQKETFQFSVTKEAILKRLHSRRPSSQQQLMDNHSAFEVISAIKQELCTHSSRHYHWAHIHGWSLGGPQDRGNLIPSTAGSNYDTLFKLEAPIKDLLFNRDNVPCVDVKGDVKLDEKGLPRQIIYQLSFGEHALIKVIIEPMDPRVPTVDEYIASRQFLYFVNDMAQMRAGDVNIADRSTLEEAPVGCLGL